MNVIDAIYGRRSISKVKAELPPRELIDKMLDAATQAPNHFHVEPWRFVVLTGQGRDRLGQAMAEIERGKQADPTSETAKKVIEATRQRAYRSPVVIVAVADPPQAERVIAVENIEAVAAGVQNMLLVAYANGLGAMWRTGDAAYDPRVKAALDLDPEAHIVGFLYVGYADVEPGQRERLSGAAKTRWIGNQDGEYSPAG